ncbi:hypothetical protein XELAEV_18011572mg [Xenopus laevis]|uniref:GIY-YIG domain-containing protein n=1 Tax=Xenopus laevis TaxID=8355 RepID=A0A974HXW0_XENLA|nr:hypothetical protein XELAEV_18011572mg [Xenopus laevis]
MVYLIMCLKCPTTWLYVGKTGQTLRQRMNSHRFNMKWPVAVHFCSNNHSIKDLRVTVLKGNFKTQQERKEWEFKLMRKFNTLECGLNRDRSFMSRYDFD